MKNRELIEKLLLLDPEADIVIDSPNPEQQGSIVAAVSVTEVQGKFVAMPFRDMFDNTRYESDVLVQEAEAENKFILIR